MKALERGDFKIARDYFEMTLNEARQIGNKDAERVSLGKLGVACQFLSDFKKAIEFYQLALRIAKDTGHKMEKELYITTLAVPISPSVISKKQSSFITWL